jgi:hypothetical protein
MNIRTDGSNKVNKQVKAYFHLDRIVAFYFLKLINSYEFKFLFTSCAFPISHSFLKRNLIGSSKSNMKLINFLSNELINLRKGIGAIFYQHFHCIDSKGPKLKSFSSEVQLKLK